MWTQNQHDAINVDCADNLVSAAAGSGKTAVMVERIVSRILSGVVDIDKILVVTFTNAAAMELKSRLMSKIMEALDSAENPEYLNRQLMLIGTASICTIDSFCLDVLRQNFYKIGLDPAVKVGDAAELNMIKDDVIDKVLEQCYASKDEVFVRLINSYTNKSDKDFADIILKIFDFSCSLPGGIDELKQLKEKFVCNSFWEEYFIKKTHEICQRACCLYDIAIDNTGVGDELKKTRDQLFDEKNNFVLILNAHTWNDVKKAVCCLEFPTMRLPNKIDPSLKISIKDPRDLAKSFKKELTSIFDISYDDVFDDIDDTKILLDKIVEITENFAKVYTDEKRAKGLVDFSDVEHLAIGLLQTDDGGRSDTAKQLMEKYAEIYVDEYQDCNGVQEKLFSLISRENIGKPNMYMVGDMKQSIYGFRGSQPSLFKHKADIYPLYTGQIRKYNKIILNKNFRSRKGVIDAVNSVFSQIMSEKCGEMDYTDSEYLYYNECSYKDVNPDTDKVDIVLIDNNAENIFSDDDMDTSEELKGIEAEAIYVANKIKEIVSDENYLVYDKKTEGYRRAKYSDIVILLRSMGEKAEVFSSVLGIAQIPSYCELKGGYYNSAEISFIINYLKIIDNPYDDVALLSVMRHPVVGFSDDDFVSIRLSKPKGNFYHCVNSYLKNNDDALSHKLKEFSESLKLYYKKSGYLSTDRLIWEIIEDTDYMSYLTFTPNSELRKANVRSLINKAHDFEKTSYKGIFDFVRYVDAIKKSGDDTEGAKILSEDEDVVRIMTIHKSKGLEFPVVFMSDALKKFNDIDLKSDKLLLHKERGFGLNYYDFSKHYYYELPQKKYIRDVKYSEMLSEEMRVLYVALTRAREKLFITGSDRNIASHIQKIADLIKYDDAKLSYHTSQKSRSFGDWILMSVLRNTRLASQKMHFDFCSGVDDGSAFELKILNKNEMVLDVDEKQQKRKFDTTGSLKSDREYVKNVFEYEYPYRELALLPSNMSVTELKRRDAEEEGVYNFYNQTKLVSPAFVSDSKQLSAADIGIATHLVMEKLDFSKTETLEDIVSQVDELKEKGFLTQASKDAVKCENIFRMFSTPLGKKMKANAHTLKREFGFKYLMDASELLKSNAYNDKIVVQGMIDAYFEDENGDIVIVDYKTDKVKSTEDIKSRYAPQLKYYKIALEKTLGKNVSATYLFLLDTGDVVEC